MRYVVTVMVLIASGFLIFQSAILGVRIMRGARLSRESESFEHLNLQAAKRLLVAGDSTGVGTGAEVPQDSIAGLIHRDFPHVAIKNISRNGARIRDVIGQLRSVGDRHFDLVIIQVGGNDILRFTRLDTLRQEVKLLMEEARKRADCVILMSTGNVGLAPAFFPPINWIYTRKTRQVRSLFIELSKKEHFKYIDLFTERRDDPFLKNPSRYYASDLLHPSAEGYYLWYGEMKRQSSIERILSPAQMK